MLTTKQWENFQRFANKLLSTFRPENTDVPYIVTWLSALGADDDQVKQYFKIIEDDGYAQLLDEKTQAQAKFKLGFVALFRDKNYKDAFNCFCGVLESESAAPNRELVYQCLTHVLRQDEGQKDRVFGEIDYRRVYLLNQKRADHDLHAKLFQAELLFSGVRILNDVDEKVHYQRSIDILKQLKDSDGPCQKQAKYAFALVCVSDVAQDHADLFDVDSPLQLGVAVLQELCNDKYPMACHKLAELIFIAEIHFKPPTTSDAEEKLSESANDNLETGIELHSLVRESRKDVVNDALRSNTVYNIRIAKRLLETALDLGHHFSLFLYVRIYMADLMLHKKPLNYGRICFWLQDLVDLGVPAAIQQLAHVRQFLTFVVGIPIGPAPNEHSPLCHIFTWWRINNPEKRYPHCKSATEIVRTIADFCWPQVKLPIVKELEYQMALAAASRK